MNLKLDLKTINKTKIPVIFIIYNRPDLAEAVLKAIGEYQPTQLYVVADGPINGHDKVRCDKTRELIDTINWNCTIHKNFADKNLGCKKRVFSGITWAFKTCERAIILEDDCVPAPSFFPFCEELLEMYKDDTRIGMISGNNFGFDLYDEGLSYSFSNHGYIWGWATWKRCWDDFDVDLNFLNKKNIKIIKSNISNNKEFVKKWWEGVDHVLLKNLSSWASPWGVFRYANNFLIIRPKVNLVANIGFVSAATHTTGKPDPAVMKKDNLVFPLVHPNIVLPDIIADRMLEEFFLQQPKKKRKLFRFFFNHFAYWIKRVVKFIKGVVFEKK